MLLGIGALVKDSSSRLGTRLPFGKDLGLVSTSVTNLMFCNCYPFYSKGLHCISYGLLRGDIPRG